MILCLKEKLLNLSIHKNCKCKMWKKVFMTETHVCEGSPTFWRWSIHQQENINPGCRCAAALLSACHKSSSALICYIVNVSSSRCCANSHWMLRWNLAAGNHDTNYHQGETPSYPQPCCSRGASYNTSSEVFREMPQTQALNYASWATRTRSVEKARD